MSEVTTLSAEKRSTNLVHAPVTLELPFLEWETSGLPNKVYGENLAEKVTPLVTEKISSFLLQIAKKLYFPEIPRQSFSPAGFPRRLC